MRSRSLAGLAFIIAALWAGFWVWFGIASGIGEGLNVLGVIMHTVPGIAFAAAALSARKWHVPGGIALIAVAVAALWIFRYIPERLLTPAGLVIGVPPVVSGVMFIASDLRQRE
ncbi:MAG: hypothetical protein BWY85_02263 [Firmicutes bacterium ADurb.Bin506]|nr:MAG: hypothetical protein BWY85_02263 [Firmicutes bacterium ADurb.Bin506]